MTAERDTATVLALERAALDRWGKGDPSGVYRRTPDGWRIIQTHWSETQPAKS